MSLTTVRQLLTTIVPTVGLTAVLLENLDLDDTGLDDELARAAQQFNKSAKALLASFPEETTARGYEQTKAFCDNVRNNVDLIIGTNAPRNEKRAQCELLYKDLFDGRKVFQATKGKDFRYLSDTKAEVKEMIDSI